MFQFITYWTYNVSGNKIKKYEKYSQNNIDILSNEYIHVDPYIQFHPSFLSITQSVIENDETTTAKLAEEKSFSDVK